MPAVLWSRNFLEAQGTQVRVKYHLSRQPERHSHGEMENTLVAGVQGTSIYDISLLQIVSIRTGYQLNIVLQATWLGGSSSNPYRGLSSKKVRALYSISTNDLILNTLRLLECVENI